MHQCSPGQPVGDSRLISDLGRFDSCGEYQLVFRSTVGQVVLSHLIEVRFLADQPKASYPSGKGAACNTAIGRFDSDRSLHTTIFQWIGKGPSKPRMRVRFLLVVPTIYDRLAVLVQDEYPTESRCCAATRVRGRSREAFRSNRSYYIMRRCGVSVLIRLI